MKIIYAVTQRITWLVTFISMHVFCKFSVSGRENLKNISTPLLVVANHKSWWDGMILGILFPFFSKKYIPLGFMAADKLFPNPFFNFFLNVIGACRENKGKGLDVSLKNFRSILSKNGVVTIFPYGEMIWDDSKRPRSRRGAATLVQDFPNLTILPVFLNTTGRLSVKEFLFGKNEMSVFVGIPYKIIDAKNKTIDEIQDTLVSSFHSLNKSPS